MDKPISPQEVNDLHQHDDLNVSPSSHHHSIGDGPNEAASGALLKDHLDNHPSGGGGGSVAVEDEGVTQVAVATILNFVGALVSATNAGGGEATITVNLPDGSVTSAKVADGAIITAKLADGSVTTVKIANDAVDASKISAGAVGTSELATNAVDTSKILDNAVTNAKLADNAVNTAEITDGAVTSAKIADGTITGTDIASGTITSGNIQDGTIATADLANDSVTNAKLANMPSLTIKGNDTGGAGDPLDLTAAQVAAILPLATTLAKGLIPALSGSTTQFLRGDGTWATPAGGGGGANLEARLAPYGADIDSGASDIRVNKTPFNAGGGLLDLLIPNFVTDGNEIGWDTGLFMGNRSGAMDIGNPGALALVREPTGITLLSKSSMKVRPTSVQVVNGLGLVNVVTPWRHGLQVGDIVETSPLGSWLTGSFPAGRLNVLKVTAVPTPDSFQVQQPVNSTVTTNWVTNEIFYCRHRLTNVPILARYSVGTTRTIVTQYPHFLVANTFQKMAVTRASETDFNNSNAAVGVVPNVKMASYTALTSLNRGSTVLTPPSPANSGTSLVVQAGHGTRFPATPFKALLVNSDTSIVPNQMAGGNAEVVNVTAIATDTLTIVRAQDGSTAQSVAANWFVMPIESTGFVELGWFADGYTPIGTNSNEQVTNSISLPNTVGALRVPAFPRPLIPTAAANGTAWFPEQTPAPEGWEVSGSLTYITGPPHLLAPANTGVHFFGTGGPASGLNAENPVQVIIARIHTLPTEATGIIWMGWSSGTFGLNIEINLNGQIRIYSPYKNKVFASSPNTTVVAGDYVVVFKEGRKIRTEVWTFDGVNGHTRKANGNLETFIIMNTDFSLNSTSASWAQPRVGFANTTTARIYFGRAVTEFIQDYWGRVVL